MTSLGAAVYLGSAVDFFDFPHLNDAEAQSESFPNDIANDIANGKK
jgi:hypothetical protein